MGGHLRGIHAIGIGGGGALPVTRYQETFNRADQPFYLGNAWNTQVTSATTESGSTLAGGVNVGGGFATMGGGAAFIARTLFTPAFVDRAAITAQSATRGQYAQFKVRNVVAGVSGDIGPMVYNPNPNDGNCYILLLATATLKAQINRGIGSSVSVLATNVLTYAVNDIVRIEITPGVADNTIRSYLNGVLQNTTVDNSGLRPTGGGHYGIAFFSCNVGSISFSDFDGGIL